MRHARDERRSGVVVELSTRDETLLRVLGRFRISRTADLAHLVFPGVRRDTVAARLRRLFDAGYIDVTAADRASENVYSLGPKGKTWMSDHGHAVGRVPRDRDHHLAVVRAWGDVACAVHALPGVRLALVRSDWELADRRASLAVVPDLFIEFSVDVPGGHIPVRLCVEVDMGSEAPAVWARKLAAYEAARESPSGLLGWRDFGLALVTGGNRGRRGRLARLISAAWSGWWIAWSERDEVRSCLRTVVEAVRAPLTGSPSGKGWGDDVSASTVGTFPAGPVRASGSE